MASAVSSDAVQEEEEKETIAPLALSTPSFAVPSSDRFEAQPAEVVLPHLAVGSFSIRQTESSLTLKTKHVSSPPPAPASIPPPAARPTPQQSIAERGTPIVPLDFSMPVLPPIRGSTVDKIEELLRRASNDAARKSNIVSAAKKNASSAQEALNATVEANERSEAMVRFTVYTVPQRSRPAFVCFLFHSDQCTICL